MTPLRKASAVDCLLFTTVLLFALAIVSPWYATAQQKDEPGELILPGRSNAPVPLPAHAAAGPAYLVMADSKALEQARINLDFFDGRRAVAIRDRTEEPAVGGFVWVGRIDGEPLSRVSIAARNGTVAGVIDRPMPEGNELMEIHPVAPGISVLFHVDEALLPPRCSLPGSVEDQDEPLQAENQPAVGVMASAPVTINLMVVYTPASAARNGGQAGLEAMIAQAVADGNTGYVNSQIGLQMQLVYVGEVNYAETGHMVEAVNYLANGNDGYLDEVYDLRASYHADLVALIDEDTDYCGDALMIRPLTKYKAQYYAFCVVYSGCLSSLTLPHELGHLQGCHHNREDALDLNGNLQQGAFSYSYGWRQCGSRKNSGFRTVMCYGCPWPTSATRINYFSNPEVPWKGYPTGVPLGEANEADNAFTMVQTAPTVAGFRDLLTIQPPPSPPPPPATPTGLTATPVSASEIRLAWTLEGTCAGFFVGRSTDQTTWKEQNIGLVLTYSDQSASPNTLCYYRVRAYNEVHDTDTSQYGDPTVAIRSLSDFSNVASATPLTPAAPLTLAARALSAGQIQLTWAAEGTCTGFLVERSSGKSTWTQLPGTVTGTTFTDSGLSSSTLYYYRVRAYQDLENGLKAYSTYSNTASAKTLRR